MNRNKLRAVHVVEQTYLADAFQGCDQDRFGQDREANTEADIDGFLKVVALFSKTPATDCAMMMEVVSRSCSSNSAGYHRRPRSPQDVR